MSSQSPSRQMNIIAVRKVVLSRRKIINDESQENFQEFIINIDVIQLTWKLPECFERLRTEHVCRKGSITSMYSRLKFNLAVRY